MTVKDVIGALINCKKHFGEFRVSSSKFQVKYVSWFCLIIQSLNRLNEKIINECYWFLSLVFILKYPIVVSIIGIWLR